MQNIQFRRDGDSERLVSQPRFRPPSQRQSVLQPNPAPQIGGLPASQGINGISFARRESENVNCLFLPGTGTSIYDALLERLSLHPRYAQLFSAQKNNTCLESS